MPWRCPACRTVIRHSDAEEQPRRDALYRCAVCRLELRVNPLTGLLDVAPIQDSDKPPAADTDKSR